jgi:hypothetical protein
VRDGRVVRVVDRLIDGLAPPKPGPLKTTARREDTAVVAGSIL